MPDIIYYVAVSLDGCIATPDGGVDWLAPFAAAGEDYGYAAFYASVDALLLGRRTWEQILTLGEWPYPGKPCRVFSRQRFDAEHPDVTVTDAGPRTVVAELHARGCRRLWLVGGADLAAAFRTEGLISEYIISVMPVILGGGIPLFNAPGPPESLVPADTRSWPDGVVQLRYRRRDAGHSYPPAPAPPVR